MSQRLNQQALAGLAEYVAKPTYARTNVDCSIVHIGVGAFHRCHQAVVADHLMKAGQGNWHICGVSLHNPKVRDDLLAQDNLYTVTTKNGGKQSFEIVGSLNKMLVAWENPQAVVDVIAAKQTKLITLTITEKGYCLNQASGELNWDDERLQQDLNNLAAPQTVIGYLVAGLQLRKKNLGSGLNILSCDNLSENGHKLKKAVLSFAQRFNADLALWIENNCRFPCSMVDRIVPATTDADCQLVQSQLGIIDQAVVTTEPFLQWIIEDNFVGDRPEWESAGVMFVDDIAPFENMKLRLLNASHSVLAYLGVLAGYKTVAQAMSNKAFSQLVESFMAKEMQPTLKNLQGFDLEHYRQQLLQRFSNTGLEHLLLQIATDGSQKIPQRLLPSIDWQLANNGNYKILSLAIAGWVRFTQGINDAGETYRVNDPLKEKFAVLTSQYVGDDEGYMQALLYCHEVFQPDFVTKVEFINEIKYWLNQLRQNGALKTMELLSAQKN